MSSTTATKRTSTSKPTTSPNPKVDLLLAYFDGFSYSTTVGVISILNWRIHVYGGPHSTEHPHQLAVLAGRGCLHAAAEQ